MIRWFWLKTLREREYLEDLGVDGRIVLKWNFKTWDGDVDWLDLAQDRDKVTEFFENGNESSVTIKGGEFIDYLRIC